MEKKDKKDLKINTNRVIRDFFNRLVENIESMKTRGDNEHFISLLEFLLETIRKSLEAQWAGIIQQYEKTWVVLTKTEGFPTDFPPPTLFNLLMRQVAQIDNPEKAPIALDSTSDIERYVPGIGIFNLAIIPYKLPFNSRDINLLCIGNKKDRIQQADDLPYFIYPLLRHIAALSVLGNIGPGNRLQSWRESLYRGSREEILKLSTDYIRSFGDGLSPAALDAPKASAIDALLLLNIRPHFQTTAQDEIIHSVISKIMIEVPVGDAETTTTPLTTLARIRQEVYEKYSPLLQKT